MLDVKYSKKTKDGIYFELDLNDYIQQHIFWFDYFEKVELAVFKRLLLPGMVFFDIGSNIGNYSVVASRYAKSEGAVHCFEPNPLILAQLKLNFELNNASNIYVNEVAIADIAGEVVLYISRNDNSGTSGLTPAINFSNISHKVRAITIDEYVKLKEIEKINIIKIDIEGFELMALFGMKETLVRFKPLLLLEIKKGNLKQYNVTTQQIYQFLKTFGYTPYSIINDHTIRMIYSDDVEGDLVLFSPSPSQLIVKYGILIID